MDHPCYQLAKHGSSSAAALTLVQDLLSDRTIAQIGVLLQNRPVRIVGVHAEEAGGRNKIPLTYAEVLAEILENDTDPGIVQSVLANHSQAPSVYHRFVSPPAFDGYVEREALYFLVDDTCTAGGTLTNLKGYIETHGGVVVGMSVLAYGRAGESYDIALAPETQARLNRKHKALDALLREEFGYGLEALTEGEAGHLQRAPSTATIRSRLAEARRDLGLSRGEDADCGAEDASGEGDHEASGTGEGEGS